MIKNKKMKLILLGISLLVFTLFFTSCSEKSSNQAPVIESLNKNTSGLEVTVTGSASDSDGRISEITITWGNGNSDIISSGFDSISKNHTYNSAGTYDVTITATDNDGNNTSQTISVTVGNLEMVTVSKGTAADGSTSISWDIEMGKYEVTHTEFIEFLNSAGVVSDGSYEGKELIDMDDSDCAIAHDGSFYFAGNGRAESETTPVIEVTWYGAVVYCNWLSEQEGLIPAYDSNNWELKGEPQNLEGYRLPTETEWEYAARGGINGENTTYAGSDNIDDVAWYKGNSGEKTHSVGEKQANELGIYDMSGNVWEWTDISEGSDRIFRGGSWGEDAGNCAVEGRGSSNPSYAYSPLGFRLIKTK